MYIGLHNHTDHSNYRLVDCINKVKDLIKYAHELGHSGIAITDHEAIGASVEAFDALADFKSKDAEGWKGFKVIIGNEIYLCNRSQIDNREYVFPHFILIAKNAHGHKGLTELSTNSWLNNAFTYVNMRVPTYKEDLENWIVNYKGDIIASTACLGGELPNIIMSRDIEESIAWIKHMQDLFGEENFFLEMQPSLQEEQIFVNKAMLELSERTGAKYIITTDSHYLKKEDRKIHEAFLKSKEEEREVADFYATTYLMTEEEIHSYMDSIIGEDAVSIGIDNTMLVYNMVEEYSLNKPMTIPYVPDSIEEPNKSAYNKYVDKIPSFKWLMESEYPADRHLLRELLKEMNKYPDIYLTDEAYDKIEECVKSIQLSSEKMNCHWSAYLLMTASIIKVCWDSGTLVAPSRGSGGGFVLLSMLDIIQMNPLLEECKTYAWRFLNPTRVSNLDVDSDIIGEYRDVVIENLQKKYGGYLRVAKVQTLSTSAPRKSIQIACRGLGYTPEEGIMLGSFIKSDRGLTRSLSQTFYGDQENDFLPDQEFVNLMTGKYSDVWEVAQRLEGLIVGVGQHAGGVVITDHDITDNAPLMRTRAGAVITQYDLHRLESCSLIKWDILATDCLGKIKICLNLLLKDKLIEWQGSWKDTYEKYLGVYKIERNNPKIWDMIDNHEIMSLFQMEKASGYKAIELGKPRSLKDMAALNSVMRLMPQEPGGESPLDRYARMREDIGQWYEEMEHWGLTKEEQKWLEQYALSNFGLLPNQENFMIIVQDPMIGGYSLLWADKLRKAIAKKNPKAFNELQEEFFKNVKEKGLSEKLCEYVWKVLICMSKGYGFNTSHTLGYSIIALQEANLAYHYPTVYWNCAVLISDSGGEDSTVNYDKIATAVSRLRKEGINIALPDINESGFDFQPIASDNKIVFGLKPIRGVGAFEANAIVANRPYASLDDFLEKIKKAKEEAIAKGEDFKFGATSIIQLIKAGAFDELEKKPREEIMNDFLYRISSPIKSLNLSHIPQLKEFGLLTEEQLKREYKWYIYRDYIYNHCQVEEKAGKSNSTWFYALDEKTTPMFEKYIKNELKEDKDYYDYGHYIVKRGSLEKIFEIWFKPFKENVLNNADIIRKYNERKVDILREQKCPGSISKWEMDSLTYYYHEHELAHINKEDYVLSDFFELPEEPQIVSDYFYKGQQKYRYNLSQICGTVISKDSNHNTVSLLTDTGVVVLKLYKGEYNFYDTTVAYNDANGEKHIIDNSWFDRGTLLIACGFRSEDNFIIKRYKDSMFAHALVKITSIDENGNITIQGDKPDVGEES